MNRGELIEQVKNEYARLADVESRQHMIHATSDISAEAYYENLLNKVEKEIENGTFDRFSSGLAIVEAVANDKERWLSSYQEPSR